MSAGHWAAQELYRVMRTEAALSVDCAARAAAAHQVQGKTKTQAKLADAFLVVRVLFPLASDTFRVGMNLLATPFLSMVKRAWGCSRSPKLIQD